MKVRNGPDVCQFQSHSSALNFAQKNFGEKGRGVAAKPPVGQSSLGANSFFSRSAVHKHYACNGQSRGCSRTYEPFNAA